VVASLPRWTNLRNAVRCADAQPVPGRRAAIGDDDVIERTYRNRPQASARERAAVLLVVAQSSHGAAVTPFRRGAVAPDPAHDDRTNLRIADRDNFDPALRP